MALEHAILVSLAERSASGYDLARRFDKSIGHFWQASHQQIYKVLARMEGDKWVESNLVEQAGRPDKKMYAITTDGRGELHRWTTEPTPPEALRSEFAVKIRGMQFGDRAAVISDVRRRRGAHHAQLDFYLADAAKNFPDPASVPGPLTGAYLVLRGGIRAERAGIAWCDEILDFLGTDHHPLKGKGEPMKEFRAAVEAGDFGSIGALLADDVVFHSPVAFKPYEGRPIVHAILRGVSRVFTDFRYVSELEGSNGGNDGGNDHALVFKTDVDGMSVHGCDFLHVNEEGKISELTVMVRPLSAANALAAAMGAQFEQIRAEASATAEPAEPAEPTATAKDA